MKNQTFVVFGTILCLSLFAVTQVNGASSTPPPAKPAAQDASSPAAHAAPQDPGERKFQENCSRCHNAPEELPIHITRTVLQHMRVRASLSAQDQRDILKYLAP
jgi:cytochrome c5